MSTVEQDLLEYELLEDAESERDEAINAIADEIKKEFIKFAVFQFACNAVWERNKEFEEMIDRYGHSYVDIFSFLLKRDGQDFFHAMMMEDFTQRSELEIATDIADQINFDTAATAEYERRVEEALTNAAEDKARDMEDCL